MGDKTDQAKGRVKEAVGSLTDDKDLKREGQADRLAGEAKEKAGDLESKAEELIDEAKEKAGDVQHKAEEWVDKAKHSTKQK